MIIIILYNLIVFLFCFFFSFFSHSLLDGVHGSFNDQYNWSKYIYLLCIPNKKKQNKQTTNQKKTKKRQDASYNQ